MPPTHERRASIFEVNPRTKFELDFYLSNINVIPDVSLGQRNYHRNLEGVLDTLINKKNQISGLDKKASEQ